MKKVKVLTAAEAAMLVKDGDTDTFSCSRPRKP